MRLVEKHRLIGLATLKFHWMYDEPHNFSIILNLKIEEDLSILSLLIVTDHLVTRETYPEAKRPCTKSSNAVTAMQRREQDTKRH